MQKVNINWNPWSFFFFHQLHLSAFQVQLFYIPDEIVHSSILLLIHYSTNPSLLFSFLLLLIFWNVTEKYFINFNTSFTKSSENVQSFVFLSRLDDTYFNGKILMMIKLSFQDLCKVSENHFINVNTLFLNQVKMFSCFVYLSRFFLNQFELSLLTNSVLLWSS